MRSRLKEIWDGFAAFTNGVAINWQETRNEIKGSMSFGGGNLILY